jgi:two-component system, OmpR family, sensor histidine kinase BaeS
MKLGITSKLFLAISTSCIAIAVAMGAAMRVSFENGFFHYLGERNTSSTSQLANALEGAYAQHGNWNFLRNDSNAWTAFIANAHLGNPQDTDARPEGPGGPGGDMLPPDAPPGPPPGQAGNPDGSAGPPFGGPPPDAAGPPSAAPGPAAASQPTATARAPDQGPGGPGRFPPSTLFDAQKHRVAGNGPLPPPGSRLQSLKVAGQVVGWLSVASPENLLYSADRQFQVRQLRATWIIVALAALLAAGVAMVLARIFLAPIRRLVDATHRLASGDYATRVPEGSGDEFNQLAKDFNQLAESLAEAESSRRNFIADISHELRTPLAVLRGELEAIEDGVRHLDRASLSSLQSEVTMLSQLIDDLYELSLADIGALSFEKVPVDAAGIVRAAADAFEERLNTQRIALETDIAGQPAIIVGDPHRLTQLLKNLLENALRYTDPGGKVCVSVSTHVRQLHIDVQDTYPGVPEPLLPHLFERMFRVDVSRSRQSGGAGLGLALCRHIAEAHDGTIEAARSPLGGLWIKLRFPLQPSHHD